MSTLRICFIRCLDCGHVIDDYDPKIDQYTCKKCRDKAARKYEAWKKKHPGVDILTMDLSKEGK